MHARTRIRGRNNKENHLRVFDIIFAWCIVGYIISHVGFGALVFWTFVFVLSTLSRVVIDGKEDWQVEWEIINDKRRERQWAKRVGGTSL